MRRIFPLVLSMTLLAFTTFSSSTIAKSHPTLKHAPSLKPLQMHIPHILAIGDSLTGGYYASDQAHDYLSLVTKAFQAQAIDTHGTYGVSALRTLPDLLSSPPPAADIVIVELGTNDVNSTNPETTGQFATAYTQILSILRTRNPHAKLVCLGTWHDHRSDDRDAAIQAACQADQGVYRSLMPLYYYDGSIYHGPAGRATWLGPGDWFHPNDQGHAAIALLVENAINAAVGDESDPNLNN